MRDLKGVQTEQFRRISENFEQLQGRVNSAIYRILQDTLYRGLEGKHVLDVGNGGRGPKAVFGAELGSKIGGFVGVDTSLDMLRASEEDYPRVKGDGTCLPFKDKSFDHVLVNGVLHHLGYTSVREQEERLERFFREATRVSRGEVLVYEIFLPVPLELLERSAAALLGLAGRPMPTFLLSERTLDRVLGRVGLQRRIVTTFSLSKLMGPFDWQLLSLDHPWFKLPAFMNPIYHSVFKI